MDPVDRQKIVEKAEKYRAKKKLVKAAIQLTRILEAKEKFSLEDLSLFVSIYKDVLPSDMNEDTPRNFDDEQHREAFKILSKTYLELIQEYFIEHERLHGYGIEEQTKIHLLIADINRYQMEFGGDNTHAAYKEDAIKHYGACFNNAMISLAPDNDTRLAFCMNFAKFKIDFDDSKPVALNLLKFTLKEVMIMPNSLYARIKCESTLDRIRETLTSHERRWKLPFEIALKSKQKMVLLINICTFDLVKSNRKGARKETHLLYKIFKQKNYLVFPPDVLDRRYWSKQSILKELSLFKDESCMALADQVVVYLSSHGTSEGIQTSDFKLLSDVEVMNRLLDTSYPNMFNKPKLVINNSCRVFLETEKDLTPMALQSGSEIVFLHSTLPGQVSFRTKNSGSYLAFALIEVFSENKKIKLEDFITQAKFKLFSTCKQQLEVRMMNGICRLDYNLY